MLRLSLVNMPAEARTAADEILLLSDHQREVDFVRCAARNSRLHVVAACEDVLGFLRRERIYKDAPRPDLILLDLDLENQDDCDTLANIKADPDLRCIPLVVLGKEGAGFTARAYDLQANAYVAKPGDPARFVEVMKGVLDFWLKLARLPGQGN